MQRQSPGLLIETSTERAIVGYVQDGIVLYKNELPFGLDNSKHLAPAVQTGLRTLGISFKEVAYVAVGIGPGSYTGIRVGAMLAKTLAFVSDIPLIGISTLNCFSSPVEGPFAVLIDAKISGVYAINGIKKDGQIRFLSDPQVLPLDKVDCVLTEKTVVITPRKKSVQEKLEAGYPGISWFEEYPDLNLMASQAEEKLLLGETAKEGMLELMYLRKTQAESEKEKSENLNDG